VTRVFDFYEREQLYRFANVGCGLFVLIMLGLAFSAVWRVDWTVLLDLFAAAGGLWIRSVALRYARPRIIVDESG
jgi:hypothetical protein